eukprot:538967-Rhodomonas_salina.1
MEEVSDPICLRAPYAMSGTDVGYRAPETEKLTRPELYYGTQHTTPGTDCRITPGTVLRNSTYDDRC